MAFYILCGFHSITRRFFFISRATKVGGSADKFGVRGVRLSRGWAEMSLCRCCGFMGEECGGVKEGL